MMKKISASFSMDSNLLEMIDRVGGKNRSENLNYLLNQILQKQLSFVVIDKEKVAEGFYEPDFIKDKAFLVFMRTSESKEIGHNLPFTIDPFGSITEITRTVEKNGFKVQKIEFADLSFVAIYAIAESDLHRDICTDCKFKLNYLRIKKITGEVL